MSELYVGNLNPNTTKQEIERQFQFYGEILTVKIPRTSSSRRFAFVEYKDPRDSLFAMYSWNGKFNWRVEPSRNSETKDIKKIGVKQSQRGRLKKNQVASSSIWKPVPPPPPPWLELPEDITLKILHKLGPTEILKTAQTVCTTWRKICRDPAMWRVIDMWKLRDVDYIKVFPMNGDNEFIFDLALDLSQGQATEINIELFGSDKLLEEIAERCGQLRCLRLAFCYNVSWKKFSKVVKFPLLEELDLQCTYVEKDGIEAIGQSCPMLKSFALNGRGKKRGVLKPSEDTLAIAKSMPELHHLQLFGNGMNNDALEAILNGCPKLESLDLRQCLNLNLEGNLGKRCAQQIKILRRPHDSLHDYEWDGKIPGFVSYGNDDDFSDDSDYDLDYLDLDYDDDFDYDDYCDPFQFDGYGENSDLEDYFGLL